LFNDPVQPPTYANDHTLTQNYIPNIVLRKRNTRQDVTTKVHQPPQDLTMPRTKPTTHAPKGRTTMLLAAGLLAMGVIYYGSNTAAAEKAVAIPAPSANALAGLPPPAATETAVFAGGCFWGIQAVFQHTRGVSNAVSGYAGGERANPSYEEVSSGRTGHAESVKVTFDPKQVSYAQLLQIYFSVAHDPTQLNQQYPDTGTQYRSAVFAQDAGQKQVAERYIAELDQAHVFRSKIVTQVNGAQTFYPAEGYHQNYATLHPESGYIARFDLPKISNLKAMMPSLYREQPVLVP
jgi:peptide-methionine (S)-S-oxide reductase